MNNLIEERDERTQRRKKYKRKVDRMFNLSFKDKETIMLTAHIKELSDSRIRLLDEGAIVGDDYIDFIIKKGTLEKYLDGRNEYLPNLTDDFIGSVNLGHMDFATFPFIIGEWKKSDLSLVDIDDDGRKGIDVELHLDGDSVFVQELQRQPYDIGISSEFYFHPDWEATDDVGYLVVDEVYIFAYGLVGECGNVNSSGLELKGETNMSEEKRELAIEETEEVKEEIFDEAEEMEEAVGEMEEEVEEEPTEELSEEQPEEVVVERSEDGQGEEADDENEEAESEEAELELSEEAEGDEVELAEVLTVVNELRTSVAELTEEVSNLREANASLKKTNKKLSKKLQDEIEKKEAFIKSAKGISVKLGINEEAKPKKEKVADAKFAHGDGIGD